jgi:pimeloyl-ACP methyl ester carboxylesterase
MSIAIRELTVNGMRFRCRVAGERGEPVILLHGFPETSAMWTELMPRLVQDGYRCLAPDLRGYSPGARPSGSDQYALELIAQDVVSLAASQGYAHYHLIGHDWGAAAGWTVVRDNPEQVKSWTAISVPHLAAYMAGYLDEEQRRKGAYIQEYLTPGEGEAQLAHGDYELMRKAWSRFCPDKIPEYLEVFSQPGALVAALNWYRAAFGSAARRNRTFAPFDVRTPTLTLWGNRDPGVGRATTRGEAQYMKGSYRFVELDGEHFILHECSEICTREILAHLRALT